MSHDSSTDTGYKKHALCLIVRHAQIAGTEKHVYMLARNLNKKFFETHVCIFEQGDIVDMLRKQEIETTVIPKSHSLLHFLKLIRFLRQGKYDIVHCHSGGYACVAAKLGGIKRIVYTKHGIGFTSEELRQRSFFRKLRDFIVDKCVTKYIALTKYDKHIMRHVLCIDANKIEIVHNGIDPSFSKIGLPHKERYPIIGVVGRLAEQKGISYLINAIPVIAEKYKDVKVLIAGSGGEESALRNQAHRVGVLKRIEFLGYVKDVVSIINRMDIFVLPSVWEGFPYVLLEAMLLRKPVVATNIFGVNEIIEHNESGILVKPRDSMAIANAVILLLSDKQKARRIGNAGYQRVLSRFTLDRTVSKIEQTYLSLMRTAPHASD